jgi:hypothetical protein
MTPQTPETPAWLEELRALIAERDAALHADGVEGGVEGGVEPSSIPRREKDCFA